MNIPADLPCPDQENVYYSVESIIQELSNFLEAQFLKNLSAKLKEYNLPAFVLNTDDAPNSYQIDVYPRGGTKFNISLDSNGAVSVTNKIPIPETTPPDSMALNDGGGNVSLDPSFYSNTKMKSKDFFTEVAPDDEALTGLDTLLSTKFWCEKDLLMERNQFLEFATNVVSEKLQSLPEETFEKLKEEYDKKNINIDGILQTLADIKAGEEKSIGGLFPSSLKKMYPQSSTRVNTLNVTRRQFVQSLSDLNNSRTLHGKYKRGRIQNTESNSIQNPSDIRNSQATYRTVWNNLISRLLSNGHIDDEKIAQLKGGQISNAGPEIDALLNFSDRGNQKETFSENGWVSEWYYDNFAKILMGEDLDFGSLDRFLELYESTLTQVENVAKISITGGNFLLVVHAIKKAMLDLCQSNLDVSSYAPLRKGRDIFTIMGRPSVLGPSGCHQKPSRYEHNSEEYEISNFSKSGFLCYHALLKLIDKAWNYSRTRNFILANIENYDSDHDKVINMWDDISEKNLTSKQTVGVRTRVNNAGAISYKRHAMQDRRVAHLYRINESFTGEEIYLIPRGDDKLGESERTFIGYNIRGVDHTREEDLVKSNSEIYLAEGYGLRSLSEQDSSAVGRTGLLSIYGAPNAYKLMGYVASVSRVMAGSSTTSSSGGKSYSRNERVHYGVIDSSKWDSSVRNNDCFDFWAQKNYNLPYFWASTMSLFKAITIETYKNLILSVNSILGTNIELSESEILDMFDITGLWNAINLLVGRMLNNTGLVHHCAVRVDGTIAFTDDVSNVDLQRMWKDEYRNTSGDFTAQMLRNYAKFASSISAHDSIQIVDEQESIEFDYATYIPAEGLAVESNPNFKNTHGGSSAYITDQFADFFDPFEFREIEFLNASPMNKSKGALGDDPTYSNLYDIYVTTSKEMHQHSLYHREIRKGFENIRKFIETFSISDNVLEVFQEGQLDIKNDIKNPGLLIDQITSNRQVYSATPDGIATRWANSNIENPVAFVEKSRDWLYCYVLGIKKSSFNSEGEITIVPQYIGSGDIVELSDMERTFSIVPTNTSAEIESAEILKYFHLMRGLDITETTFSAKNELIYDEHVIESGVLGLEPDQFEEGVPKEKVDTIFSISPYIYPTNYFNKVCLQNEYARVVGIVIKGVDLENYSDVIDSVSQKGVLKEIIGSIRFVRSGDS